MFPIYESNAINSIEAEQMALSHVDGLAKIDSGCYARVYTNNEIKHIVKVFRLHDVAYLTFLKVMAEMEFESKHLPKIHEVILYRTLQQEEDDGWIHPGFGVVIMEKLRSGRIRVLDERTGMFIGNRTRHEKLARSISSRFEYTGLNDKGLNQSHRDVLGLVQLAYEETQSRFPENNSIVDLHAGNIMWRGNTFVITDPIA